MGFSVIVAAVEKVLGRSPTLCLASLAVLAAARSPMATSYCHQDAESSDDPLLDAVRTRLASGALFPADRKSWARRATGERCAVCDVDINNPEMEYEVAGGPSGSAFAHLECYLVWR